MRISDWSSDVCSSDLDAHAHVWGERPVTRIEEHAVELGTVLAPVVRIGNTVAVELVPRPAQFPAPILIDGLADPNKPAVAIVRVTVIVLIDRKSTRLNSSH